MDLLAARCVPAEIRDRLWEAVRNGQISQVSSTTRLFLGSQAPRRRALRPLPERHPGIEVRLALLYSEGVVKGRISLPRLAEVTASALRASSARPRKGSLEPGSDADIVLLDPGAEWVMGPNRFTWRRLVGLRGNPGDWKKSSRSGPGASSLSTEKASSERKAAALSPPRLAAFRLTEKRA